MLKGDIRMLTMFPVRDILGLDGRVENETIQYTG